MPLGLLLGLWFAGMLCMATGIVAMIRRDMRGPAHSVSGASAVSIMVGLGGFLWLGSLLPDDMPGLRLIGLILMLAADEEQSVAQTGPCASSVR
jgi:low temperature requirement protein LtrA